VGIDANVVMDLGLWTMLAGIAGARIFHMIQFHDHYVGKSLFSLFEVWRGGLVFYGGMIGSIIAGVIFLRMRKISVLRITDVIAPAVPLGIAFARFGCFLNGCCFGRSCDPDFILAIQDPKKLEKTFIHPTQLYSSLDAFVIFVLVVIYSRLSFRRRAHGEVFALFVILYGAGRFLMESFRNDTGPVFGTGGTIAQVMSVAFIVVALPWFAWLQMEKRKGLVGPADKPVETPSGDKDS
jgi:phosphatidylglycerol:prolipoprotein diacylglycerol transferase